MQRARRDYDCVINWDDGPSTAADTVAMSARVDAMIPCHSEHFSAEVAVHLDKRLRIIANHSVGVDHCDLPALKARGIAVTIYRPSGNRKTRDLSNSLNYRFHPCITYSPGASQSGA